MKDNRSIVLSSTGFAAVCITMVLNYATAKLLPPFLSILLFPVMVIIVGVSFLSVLTGIKTIKYFVESKDVLNTLALMLALLS